jgi:hypothetical protein
VNGKIVDGRSLLCAAIGGRGPSTPDKLTSVIAMVLGIVLLVGAFLPATRLRGAFSYGKGPSVPIGSAGRLILFIAAVVMFAVGIQGLFH